MLEIIMLKYRADSSAYNNLLYMYIFLLKGKRQEPAVGRWSFFQMFFKIGFLKNFRIFTGKHLVLESPFNKVVGLDTSNFIKNRLQHRCLPVKFAKLLTTSFLTEHLCWLLLNGVESLQIIQFFSTLIIHLLHKIIHLFFDEFSWKFFPNRFFIHKNYVQNIHCLALIVCLYLRLT